MALIRIAYCFFLASLFAVAAQAQAIVYVDPNAPGNSDGTSWQDAYHDLQDALTAAMHDTVIRLAEGIYNPGPAEINSFHLKNGVTIKGGYAGYGAPIPDARNIQLYESVLDGRDFHYHVVRGANLDSTAILDGVTVANGRADGGGWEHSGGGIWLGYSSPIIRNCTIRDNYSYWQGGGIRAYYCDDLIITRCRFINNRTDVKAYSGYCNGGAISCDDPNLLKITFCTFDCNFSHGNGGGIYIDNYGNSCVIKGCLFTNNMADEDGGGICNNGKQTHITECIFNGNQADIGGGVVTVNDYGSIKNCDFIENQALYGGGLANFGDSPQVYYCTFEKNAALENGGGFYNDFNANPVLINNLFYDNTAQGTGGGMSNTRASLPILINCTFHNNTAGTNGGAIYNDASHPRLTNCILWSNEPEGLYDEIGSQPEVTYSCNQDGYPGEGNITEDPVFADPTNGDFHLTRFSSCVNRGNNQFAPDDDIEGKARPFMGTVDMGAHEYRDTHALSADVYTLPRSTGGQVLFSLEAGTEQAGKWYVIVGSLSGTAPGMTLPGGKSILPINPDGFTNNVLNRLNTPVYANFLAVLNSAGSSSAEMSFKALGFPLGWVGKTMSFAYTIDTFDLVSNPVQVGVLP